MTDLPTPDRNSGFRTARPEPSVPAATRNPDGTFAPGNPGKPPGSRHRATQAVQALLEGEAEALTRRAVERVLEGDTTALRLCLERVAPVRKDPPVVFDLPPMSTARDAASAAAAIVSAVSTGDLTPSEGVHVMGLVEAYRRTLETTELERRLAALEAAR